MIYLIKTQSGDVIGRLELASDLIVEPEQAAVAAPPPPPKTVEHKVMLPAAGSFSYEDYIESGWTDSALIANGMMKIEVVPEEPAAPSAPEAPAVHPSVRQQELDSSWQGEVPTPPPAPSAPSAPEAPVAPTPPPAPQAPSAPTPPPAPSAPSAPTPPPAPAAASEDDAPDGCRWLEETPPQIQGREFMIKDRSYERLVDNDGALFDGRVHGQSKDDSGNSIPATRKDGTFTKKRGVDPDMYAKVLQEQSRILKGGSPEQAPQAPQAPTPPPAPSAPAGVPTPPPPPSGGQAAPGTAPPAPANMEDLEKSLSDWGEEM